MLICKETLGFGVAGNSKIVKFEAALGLALTLSQIPHPHPRCHRAEELALRVKGTANLALEDLLEVGDDGAKSLGAYVVVSKKCTVQKTMSSFDKAEAELTKNDEVEILQTKLGARSPHRWQASRTVVDTLVVCRYSGQ